jgi:hypothetical protein
MMKKVVVVLGLVSSVLAAGASTANAQGVEATAGAALKVSTLGIGMEVGVPVTERVNVRGAFNTFGLSHDFDQSDFSVAAKLKLRSVVALVDWFPFAGGFHVSPGLMLHNGNRVEANVSVQPGRQFSLGNADYVSDPGNPAVGTAAISFPRAAPMVLVGWGNIVPRGSRRWAVPFELGLVYSRSPTAVLRLDGNACTANGATCRSIANEPLLQDDVANEQSEWNDELRVLKVIPVLSVGFSYKF